jgi:hypothetical protein
MAALLVQAVGWNRRMMPQELLLSWPSESGGCSFACALVAARVAPVTFSDGLTRGRRQPTRREMSRRERSLLDWSKLSACFASRGPRVRVPPHPPTNFISTK